MLFLHQQHNIEAKVITNVIPSLGFRNEKKNYKRGQNLILILKTPTSQYPYRSHVVTLIDPFKGNPILVVQAPILPSSKEFGCRPVVARSLRRAQMGVSENWGTLELLYIKGYHTGTIRVPLKGSIRVQSFRKLGVPYFGVLITRILLFTVLYQGPLFSDRSFLEISVLVQRTGILLQCPKP